MRTIILESSFTCNASTLWTALTERITLNQWASYTSNISFEGRLREGCVINYASASSEILQMVVTEFIKPKSILLEQVFIHPKIEQNLNADQRKASHACFEVTSNYNCCLLTIEITTLKEFEKKIYKEVSSALDMLKKICEPCLDDEIAY